MLHLYVSHSSMNTSHQSAPTVADSSHLAIIGGGFGALMVYAVLRFRGLAADSIRVYSVETSPERLWEKTVRAFRLTHMRSESLGHFFPTDAPGLATVESWM